MNIGKYQTAQQYTKPFDSLRIRYRPTSHAAYFTSTTYQKADSCQELLSLFIISLFAVAFGHDTIHPETIRHFQADAK
jgi:hypothetical protein